MEHQDQVEHHAQVAERRAQVVEHHDPQAPDSVRQPASQALVQTRPGQALVAAVVAVLAPPELLVRVGRGASLASRSGQSAKSLSRERLRA